VTLADFKSVGVAAFAGTGGFDSHTLPPLTTGCHRSTCGNIDDVVPLVARFTFDLVAVGEEFSERNSER
jgi:hypothetical protein